MSAQVSPQALTEELEWRACAEGFLYWLAKYWKIVEPNRGPHVIEPWPAQIEIAEVYAARESDGTPTYNQNISLKARQLGWTTLSTAYAFWTAYFREYLPWLFVSQSEDYAIKNLGMVQFGYSHLPQWMRQRGPKIVKNTTERIEFDNGSWIESIPATSSAGRGDAVWGVMWDEAAFAPDPEAMYGALEPLCYGQMILLSTANGMGNMFHEKYLDSKLTDTQWKGLFWPWSARPDRDDDWYKYQERKFRGQSWLLHQEYPRNDIEAFAKSGRVIIDTDLLDEFEWVEAPVARAWDFGEKEFKQEPVELDDRADVPILLEIWDPPKVERDEFDRPVRDPNYTIAVDVAEGLMHGDATYITVYDSNTRRCVAKVRTFYSADEIPDVVAWLGHYYHVALVGVERNNHGWGILHALVRYLRYPRLYRMEQIAKVPKGDRTQTFGWHTNVGTKPKMVQDFVREMKAHSVDPLDPQLRHELNTFIQHDNGSYSANSPHTDDGVISHMINLQLMNDIGRYPVYWYDELEYKPPTLGELAAMIDEPDGQRINPLDIPIGVGEPIGGETRPSFWVAPLRS
jgi:hypothetical protein